MTTPTTNYGWPKPLPTEYASIVAMNTLTDAMDASFKTVHDGMGAVIKPMLQMKLNASYSPGNLAVTYLASANGWEEIFNVPGTIPSANASPVILFPTTGIFTINAPGIYRFTYTINVGTYTSAAEGFWTIGIFDGNSIIVPRTKHTERMQTYTFGQGLHHSVLLKADTSGSPDIAVGTQNYRLGIMHDVPTPNVFISCKPTDLDPFFTVATVEYVRGL